MGDKRTPMAWQHRDMNYHQGGYQDRYEGGVEMGAMRQGPPSLSDRLSHRTDKSWRTQRDSQYNDGAAGPVHPGTHQANGYPPSRPSYSSGRPASRPHTSDSSTSSSSSSSSEDETDQDVLRSQIGHMPPPQPVYGYGGYYPGYIQGPMTAGYPPSISQGYPGTIKSAKSVPAIAMNTWDGEPCPVHGAGPMSLQGPHPMMGHHPMGPPGTPMMMPPIGPMSLPPRRAASIYDMRMVGSPPPAPIYGTLPVRPPGDRRSLAGAPPNIPPQLLPPMVRPRPLVVSEDGTAEPLPVRSPPAKNGTLSLNGKMIDNEAYEKKQVCSQGGICVAWIVMGVVAAGLVLGLLLIFIL